MRRVLLSVSIVAAGLILDSDANAALIAFSGAVPEPLKMLLLGFGLIGLAAFWRRRFLKRV